MTKTAQTIVAKALVAFVASAMLFTMFATPAKAATSVEDLQAMINSLMAQIAALQGDTNISGGNCAAIPAPLTIGAQNANVTALQNYLISAGHVIPAGATGYFGTQTQSALAAWQAANGVTPAVGYYGPVTAAAMAAKCVPTTGGGSTGSTGDLEGGVGDVTINETSAGVEDEVMEGEENVQVLGFDVEAEDSDIQVTSVRVEFEHDGTGSNNLDDYVTEVTVWLDGDMIGSADVEDFNETSDVYSRNITLKDAVVREGEEGRFYVAVSAVNNIDSDDIAEDWEVALGQVRFEDATGAILTDTTGTGVNGTITETFTFEDLASAGDVELTVAEDDDEINDARTVQVDDASDTNDVELLSFTIEADGSDMELSQLIIDVTSSGAGVTEIANDFRLMMGDEEVGRVRYDLDQNDSDSDHSTASSTDAAIALIFTDLDDDEVIVEKGDKASFTLVADINDIDGGFSNGDYLGASLAAADVDAEDENGDDVTDLTGTATSNNISFASEGLMVTLDGSDATQVFNVSDVSTDDQGKFEMTFEVTAFENTAWVELEAASSTDAAGDDYGVAFSVENASTGATVSTGTSTAVLTLVSGGSQSGNYARINAGQTATMKLTVYYDAPSTAIYRVQMNEVGYAATQVAATSAHDTVPAEDFQSDSVQVQN